MPVRVKYTKGDQTVVIEFSKNAQPFDVMEECRKHFFPNEVEEAYNREEEIRKNEEKRRRLKADEARNNKAKRK